MNKVMIKIIKAYQKGISPNMAPRCRHTPSCSNYGLKAYEEHSFFKATFLTTKRILSCNPLVKPKYDPVPINYKNVFKYGIITQETLKDTKSVSKD